MEHTNCDLCGSDEYWTIWDKSERDKQGVLDSKVIRDTDGNIVHGVNVMCKKCGLVYISPRMSKDELDRFYAEEYRKIYNTDPKHQAEKRHAESAYDMMKDLKGRHLDIGCSTGELIKLTGGRGIEPNEEYCNKAREKNLYVWNCTLENFNEQYTFDIITMLNALEHVLSPTEVLNKIHLLLNDDGYLLISVPNFFNRHIHASPDAFLSNAHLYNFCVETLAAYLVKCGFKIVKVDIVIEEIGEKLYVLGQKAEKKEDFVPQLKPEAYEIVTEFLKQAELAHALKSKINKMGFA